MTEASSIVLTPSSHCPGVVDTPRNLPWRRPNRLPNEARKLTFRPDQKPGDRQVSTPCSAPPNRLRLLLARQRAILLATPVASIWGPLWIAAPLPAPARHLRRAGKR